MLKWPPPSDILYPTWGLVIVGAVAALAAIRTLRTIKRQADLMQDQLRQMQDASAQTERQIKQAVMQTQETRRTAEHARDNAEAAKANADAALLNAQSLINSERAWILVDLIEDPRGLHLAQHSTSVSLSYVLECRNQGRSPAWIDAIKARLYIAEGVLPETPDFSDTQLIRVGPFHLKSMGKEDVGWFVTIHAKIPVLDEGKMAVAYGVVEYRDVFDKRRETTFGYRLNLSGRPERLEGHPRYNHCT